jgi:hypothetical protein
MASPGAANGVNDWFSEFANFVYDPNSGLKSNFDQLATQRKWGKKLKGKRWAECQTACFSALYGGDADKGKLEKWQDLCREVHIVNPPECIKGCKEVRSPSPSQRVTLVLMFCLGARKPQGSGQSRESYRPPLHWRASHPLQELQRFLRLYEQRLHLSAEESEGGRIHQGFTSQAMKDSWLVGLYHMPRSLPQWYPGCLESTLSAGPQRIVGIESFTRYKGISRPVWTCSVKTPSFWVSQVVGSLYLLKQISR